MRFTAQHSLYQQNQSMLVVIFDGCQHLKLNSFSHEVLHHHKLTLPAHHASSLFLLTHPFHLSSPPFPLAFFTATHVNRGSTFALRRSTPDFCLGGQRSLRAPSQQVTTWAIEVTHAPTEPEHLPAQCACRQAARGALKGCLAHKKTPPP